MQVDSRQWQVARDSPPLPASLVIPAEASQCERSGLESLALFAKQGKRPLRARHPGFPLPSGANTGIFSIFCLCSAYDIPSFYGRQWCGAFYVLPLMLKIPVFLAAPKNRDDEKWSDLGNYSIQSATDSSNSHFVRGRNDECNERGFNKGLQPLVISGAKTDKQRALCYNPPQK